MRNDELWASTRGAFFALVGLTLAAAVVAALASCSEPTATTTAPCLPFSVDCTAVANQLPSLYICVTSDGKRADYSLNAVPISVPSNLLQGAKSGDTVSACRSGCCATPKQLQ